MQLAHFDIATFLRDSWQRQPLLIRNPWATWQNPLAPDELAGLACEAAVESRLVARVGGRANGRLTCEDGPLDETRFARLGRKHWTLLVQAVDHHVPEVAALIEPFVSCPIGGSTMSWSAMPSMAAASARISTSMTCF